jgi:uncharacterized protein (TIGR02569 family)
MRLGSQPSREVLAAFGATPGDPSPMPGGEGLSFRAGDLVVKQVHDEVEAEWVQGLLARTPQRGFRVPEPIPTTDGRWVHRGWSASRYVEDLRPAAPSWTLIVDAGLRFADAAERARGGTEVLSGRTHRWAVADRVAWRETTVELRPQATEVLMRCAAWLADGATERHFVHGDLAGNVHLDHSGVPVILDVSPYFRARRWAAAIVIADAVLWMGADVSLARSFVATASDRDLFARALIFRLVAEQIADAPRHGALLEPYRAVLSALS